VRVLRFVDKCHPLRGLPLLPRIGGCHIGGGGVRALRGLTMSPHGRVRKEEARVRMRAAFLGVVVVALHPACGSRSDLLESDQSNAAPESGAPRDASTGSAPTATATPTATGTATAIATTAPTATATPTAHASATASGGASPPLGDAAAGCTGPVVGSSSAGPGECDWSSGVTCGGANYQIECACPRGSCVCFGPTTHVVNYPGCPSCSMSLAQTFALCGFPSPQ
jgi:hypothetical protein